MKKITLSISILLIQMIAFGQLPSFEVEPNNSFTTASPVLQNDPTTAILGGTDTIDYHGLDFSYNANFYLILQVTNTAINGTQRLDLSIFNSLTFNGEYEGNFYSTAYVMNAGDSYTDTIKICGRAADSFYLRFKSQGQFQYTMEWYPVNAYDDNIFYNNNTAATAFPFSFGIQKEASLGYEYWGNSNVDTLDFYSTTLPAANYDSVSLTIRAQSNACSGLHGMQYFCYKNGNPTPFASGYVGNNAAVNTYQEVFTSIPLNTMQQGDVLLVKYTASSPFGYRFRYKVVDDFESDVEDNCCINNGIPLSENIAASGNVGEYDYNTDEFIDQYDTYRLILPHDGAFKLMVKARNEECSDEEYALACDILDKYGNVIGGAGLANWYDYPACGEIIKDTFKFRAFDADTFYLRLRNENFAQGLTQFRESGKISYNIKYQLVDSTGSDANESYNDPVTTILPVNAGEIKKGHIGFKKNAYLFDPSDIYKTTLPADGSIRVYLKATFRGDDH